MADVHQDDGGDPEGTPMIDANPDIPSCHKSQWRGLVSISEEASVQEGIRLGLADLNAGRTIGLEGFKERVRREHGISIG